MNVYFNAELRGIEKRYAQKTGNEYHVVYLEEQDGKPFNIVAKNLNNTNIEKGSKVRGKCNLNIYQKYTTFELIELEVIK